MTSFDLKDLSEAEPIPGFHGRFVHSERMTLAFWEIDAGATLREHSHPHEQVVNVLAGRFELVLAGEPYELSPGSVLVIPSGAPHSARALTDCRILDVFQPVREDYRFG